MKILLHMCCANCAIFPVKVMREENHDVSGLFFNHNIHPYLEYKKRFDTVKEYADKVQLDLHYQDEYALETFLENVAHAPNDRCTYCYSSRLEVTARKAAEMGYDAFTSSLLYSRYQQHDKIYELGNKLAEQYGVQFYYQDFRKGWQEGIKLSKSMGLYRQQYCGCIYSEKDRYLPHSNN